MILQFKFEMGFFCLIDYILYVFVMIIIVGYLVSSFYILSGKYTSFFVRFFTVVPIDPTQLEKLSNANQKKFNALIALGNMINIIILLFALSIFSSNGNSTLILTCLLALSANSMFIRSRIRKILAN